MSEQMIAGQLRNRIENEEKTAEQINTALQLEIDKSLNKIKSKGIMIN